MSWEIVELTAVDTYPLRRSVLRDGTPSDVVRFDGDDADGTLHLGATRGGSIVAISTWMRRPFGPSPEAAAMQLRGMATDPSMRGTGVSSAVLQGGLERLRTAGIELAWARARVTALSFYERHGFTVEGDEYVDATTGIPHRDIVLDLAVDDAR